MGWSLVQAPAGQGTGSSSGQRSLAFGGNVTAGNLLVAAIATYFDASATLTVIDTQGNTWTQIGSYSTNGVERISLWATLAGAASSGANTVKVTPSVAVYIGFCVSEFSLSGGPYTFSVDGSVTNTGSSTSLLSGNIAVSDADALVLAGFCQGQTNNTLTPGTGFSQAAHQNDGSNYEACYLDYLLDGSSGSSPYQDSSSYGATVNYAAVGASIKATASGGGGKAWWFAYGQQQCGAGMKG